MSSPMQQIPLLTSSFIEHAHRWHGDQEIVSRLSEGSIHRYSYRDAYRRSCRVANLLAQWGVENGERVATLAWNSHRHFELYYGIGGSGAVIHTINPRYTTDQIRFIINDAKDSYLFFDRDLLPIVEAVAPHCDSIRGFVLMEDKARMPSQSSLKNLMCYETLLLEVPDVYDWPPLDENSLVSLCYTSGTTGNPKGVGYTHRSTCLHTLVAASANALGVSRSDCVLPVVPLFHINAWELPYICAMSGAKLVLPGAQLDGESLFELMKTERVTLSAGVPTIWMGLLKYMRDNALSLPELKKVGTGGSACPRSIIRELHETHGIRVMHGWGMTETSSVVTLNTQTAEEKGLSMDDYCDHMSLQGPPLWGVDLKVVNEEGQELPRDSGSVGELKVRGHWVCESYYNRQDTAVDEGGWLATGDVGMITPEGSLQLTDRLKDLIKSGGEWISSAQLEDIALEHPLIEMASAIAVEHPKWDERPLLVVKTVEGNHLSVQEIRDSFVGKLAKWAIPDDVVFVSEFPLGATGKIHKLSLKQRFRDHFLQ